MESGSAPYVGADAGMAGKTFSVLRLTRKGFMARGAIGFELCMGSAQRSRRDEAFHDALGKGEVRSKGQPGNRKKANPSRHQYM